tara:strand:- start:639 stop:1826 length:1188 start_codon:yes stop_codon:yes gene_type:complete
MPEGCINSKTAAFPGLGGQVIWCNEEARPAAGQEFEKPDCGWCCKRDSRFDDQLVPLTDVGAYNCRYINGGTIVACNIALVEQNNRGNSDAFTYDDEDTPFDDSGTDNSLGGGGFVDIAAPPLDNEDKYGLESGGSTYQSRAEKNQSNLSGTTASYSSGSTGNSNPCDLTSAFSTSTDDVTLKVCTVVPGGAMTSDSSCSTSYPDFGLASFTISSCADYKFNMEFDHVEYPLLWIDVCERTIYLQTAFSNPICSTIREADDAQMDPYTTMNSMGMKMPTFNKPKHKNTEKQFGYASPEPSNIKTGTYDHDKESEESTGGAEGAIQFVEGSAKDDSLFSWEACEDCGGGGTGGGGTTSPGETSAAMAPSTISSGKSGATTNWGVTKPSNQAPPKSS